MQPTSFSRAKIRALIAEGELALAGGPHPERARLDAEALLLHLLGRTDPERNRAWLIAHWDSPTLPKVGAEMRALVKRRRAGEPIQYIVGEAEFYGLPFRVTSDVLIPRPETEHLFEKVIELAGHIQTPRIADIGTGSGCIAVALAHLLPNATITAIDLSASALVIARKNANCNKATIRFLEGDLLAPVAQERFEIVVSNPPYVPTIDRDTLAVEVRDHEPALALFAGPDGLDIFRRLIPQAFACLVSGGFLVLEIGYGQSEAIAKLLAAAGFGQIEFLPDLQSISRIACAQKH